MPYTVMPIKVIDLIRYGEIANVNARLDKGKHNIVIKISETFSNIVFFYFRKILYVQKNSKDRTEFKYIPHPISPIINNLQ